MVEDRIGSKTSLEVPFWWKFLFGWKTHSSHFDLADGLASCFEELPTRTFDRRSALHHRRPAKIKIVGEQGICALDFFFHTGSESILNRTQHVALNQVQHVAQSDDEDISVSRERCGQRTS